MRDPDEYESVLDFWFGRVDEHGMADSAHSSRWYKKDPAFDVEIRSRFGALHGAVAAGSRDAWLATPRGRLAAVIVLDQFSRNMFRGDARAFAFDVRALEMALEGIDRGDDRALHLGERSFLYMPLMHSENLATQDRSVALFAALHDELPGDRQREYAERHRDIVRRFGRFPHRNATLGRTSTAEEIEFLKGEGSSF
jgi:uncharacterized protein (DUF924 family)